jgi:hypothetical protein
MFGSGSNMRGFASAVGNPNQRHRTKNGHQYGMPLAVQLAITGVLLVTKRGSSR